MLQEAVDSLMDNGSQKNISDAMTKRNISMYRVLNQICTSGTIDPGTFKKAIRVLSANGE